MTLSTQSFFTQSLSLLKSAWAKSRLLTAFDDCGIEVLEWFLEHFGLEYKLLETHNP